MKRKYYVSWGNFGNSYALYHAPADFTPPPEWERITRKEAERLARAERYRRDHEPAFSEFADAWIYPHDFDDGGDDGMPEDVYNGDAFRFDGVIIRRK